jgi:hypothetical protein
MQHTLVAVFDNRSDAQNALDELLSSGFSRSDVNLSSADATGQSDTLTGTTDSVSGEHEEGIGASIKHFFAGLFGADHSEHAVKYSNVVTGGRHVVTVTTQSEPEVERAADVIERFGPTDIDERHDLTAAQAMSGAAAGASSGDAVYANASNSGMAPGQSVPSAGSGIDTAPGALQNHNNEDRAPFGTQNLNNPVPMGQTYEEPMGNSIQTGGALDTLGGDTPGSTQGSLNQSAGATQQGVSGAASTGGLNSGTSSGLSTDSSTLLGTASIPGSNDASLGGTIQGGNFSGTTTSGTTTTGNLAGAKRSGVRVYSRPLDTALDGGDSLSQDSGATAGGGLSSQRLSTGDDDSFFRNDFDQKYATAGGSYDDYAPAYKYGNESRSKYAGRNWDDVETDLRSDWDTKYGKSGDVSTWEKFKAAVRHGWDKITPDMDDTDSHYRNHWNSTYGTSGDTYNDYEPAYKYGNEMRSNEKYRGREWNDVESDLRGDWDTRYGTSGASTWDKMKAAVQHGWNRVTS